jgi:hypothetical protein
VAFAVKDFYENANANRRQLISNSTIQQFNNTTTQQYNHSTIITTYEINRPT